MKKIILLFGVIGMSFSTAAQIQTPQPSPFSKVEQKVGLTDVTLEYSRPNMRARTVFGDLVPYGRVWRLGANENTKITFSTEVTVGGKELKAGTYALFAIPNENSWDVVFYSSAQNWGAPQELDESKIAAKVVAETYKLPVNVETFTMNFDDLSNTGATLGIMWADVYTGVKFDVPTDKIAGASIDKVMNGPSANDYYAAASYYFQEGKDIQQAKTWIDKAISMIPKPAFYHLRQQSLIYAKAGDKKGAIELAKKSLKASEEAGNPDYIKMNKDSLKEWGSK